MIIWCFFIVYLYFIWYKSFFFFFNYKFTFELLRCRTNYKLPSRCLHWCWSINQHFTTFKATYLQKKKKKLDFVLILQCTETINKKNTVWEHRSPTCWTHLLSVGWRRCVCVCFEHLLSSDKPRDPGMKLIYCPSRAYRDENKASQINNPALRGT